jgi:hypothetical protein
MNPDVLPADLGQFILETIDSVAEMEALLLLRGNPHHEWDVATVARRLYVDEKQAHAALTRLVEQNLLVAELAEPPRYRYEPGSPELKTLVDRLAEVYSRHLVPVTNLIHSKPKTRVQEFADAFKFRKDD